MDSNGSVSSDVSLAIKGIVAGMMDRIMEKVLIVDPFIAEKHHAAKPLYAALVPDEIFKGSHFERRFVTPFGNVWEKLAVVVAQKHHGVCLQGERVDGIIKSERLRRIQEVLNILENPGRGKDKIKPNWDKELNYILSGGGEKVPSSVICDLLIKSNKTNKNYAVELKAPLPNSDQTKVSKEKLFKLLAMEETIVHEAYYALPYNPYGKKEDYAWSFPMRWFDMRCDPSVLIGSEFWDIIGGTGTYNDFILSINELGQEYRERIYREYLGIEPPNNSTYLELK